MKSHGWFYKRWECCNIYSGQRPTVRTVYAETEWFSFGKLDKNALYLPICSIDKHIIRKTGLGWDEGGVKIGGWKINSLGDADDTILLAENSEYFKQLWTYLNDSTHLIYKFWVVPY